MKAGVEQKQQQKPGIEWGYNGDVINYGGVLFYLPLVETIDIRRVCVYIYIYAIHFDAAVVEDHVKNINGNV